MTATAAPILSYNWIVGNTRVPKNQSKTVLSKTILYRGENVFRLGAHLTSQEAPVVSFVAINLNRIGLKVYRVTVASISKTDEVPSKFDELVEVYISDNMQKFSNKIDDNIGGKSCFRFCIQVMGITDNYSYRQTDRQLKSQLWASLIDGRCSDVKLFVKDKIFSAHKSILAARSSVFAGQFAQDTLMEVLYIEETEPSTMEEFLHFLYTGEPLKSLANEGLRRLAVRYELNPLARLCDVALKKIDGEQVLEVAMQLHMKNETSLSMFADWSEKEAELFHDPATFNLIINSTLLYTNWGLNNLTLQPNRFCAGKYLIGSSKDRKRNPHYSLYIYDSNRSDQLSPHIENEVKEAYCSVSRQRIYRMQRIPISKNGRVNLFYSDKRVDPFLNQTPLNLQITFELKISNSLKDFVYEFMDTTWSPQLWLAAISCQLTDVEIAVSEEKIEAHRIVLSARSPVFHTLLSTGQSGAKSLITVTEKVDFEVFKHFLEFIYTGALNMANREEERLQLLSLAENYQVETLLKLCQLQANSEDLGPDEITDFLLRF